MPHTSSVGSVRPCVRAHVCGPLRLAASWRPSRAWQSVLPGLKLCTLHWKACAALWLMATFVCVALSSRLHSAARLHTHHVCQQPVCARINAQGQQRVPRDGPAEQGAQLREGVRGTWRQAGNSQQAGANCVVRTLREPARAGRAKAAGRPHCMGFCSGTAVDWHCPGLAGRAGRTSSPCPCDREGRARPCASSARRWYATIASAYST